MRPCSWLPVQRQTSSAARQWPLRPSCPPPWHPFLPTCPRAAGTPERAKEEKMTGGKGQRSESRGRRGIMHLFHCQYLSFAASKPTLMQRTSCLCRQDWKGRLRPSLATSATPEWGPKEHSLGCTRESVAHPRRNGRAQRSLVHPGDQGGTKREWCTQGSLVHPREHGAPRGPEVEPRESGAPKGVWRTHGGGLHRRERGAPR